MPQLRCQLSKPRVAGVSQALLEFNTDVPAAARGKPLPVTLKFFEAFWDSGHPRLGERPGECGWSHWLASKTGGAAPSTPWGSAGDWAAVAGIAADGRVDTEATFGVLDARLALRAMQRAQSAAAAARTASGAAVVAAAGGGAGPGSGSGPAGGTGTAAAASMAGSGGDAAQAATVNVSVPYHLSAEKTGSIRGGVQMVYSIMHGYMIPMAAEDGGDSTALYRKILGELREENGTDEREAARAARAARNTVVAETITADDRLSQCSSLPLFCACCLCVWSHCATTVCAGIVEEDADEFDWQASKGAVHYEHLQGCVGASVADDAWMRYTCKHPLFRGFCAQVSLRSGSRPSCGNGSAGAVGDGSRYPQSHVL